MKIVSTKSVCFVLIAVGVLYTSLALAAPSMIAGGKHDFSFNGGAFNHDATNPAATQVCVYCHTPHNAGNTRALWNKDNKNTSTQAANYKLYTSSSTLTAATKSSKLSSNSPSLLCLSCHDGKTAINVMHTSGSGASAAPSGYPAGSTFAYGNAEILMPGAQYDFFSGALIPSLAIGQLGSEATGTGTGDNLTDDHPIGFSYSAVYTERSAGLNPIGTPQAAGIRFFGATNKVECSTCHDPHINYNGATGGDVNLKPFLVMSNSGSALCLKCHNK